MQVIFLIHESFIFNLPPQTSLVCVRGEDRHEKNKTLLSEERSKIIDINSKSPHCVCLRESHKSLWQQMQFDVHTGALNRIVPGAH